MARTLATSFLASNPGSEFTILVVDALPGELAEVGDHHLRTPHDLALPAAEFARMALLYDVTELSTALKPWALQMVLDSGAELAVYLDPDIYVFSPLVEVAAAAAHSSILLTPHTVVPMRRDGLRPSEADIMGAGVYNLGFIAVTKDAKEMLGWWQERLRRDCISAPEQMLFTDQRWIDLVPGYFAHGVLRHPGYNVAYWNLDTRRLEFEQDRYLVDGQPLRFFHFSGYRPETPWILSKYVADRPRVVLSEHPLVRQVCDEYAERLSEQGFERSSGTAYRFGRLNDGTAVNQIMRRVYRNAVIEAERGDATPPPVPFADDDAELLRWFAAPVEPNSWVNRLVHGLWQARPDLQLAFPDPFAADQSALLSWCLSSGVRESGLPAALLPTGITAEDALVVLETDVAGINLAGYFRTETGVGQIGRLLVEAVRATGLPYTTVSTSRSLSRQQAEFDSPDTGVRYPITIATINADQFPVWVRDAGRELVTGRYVVGVWAWEVEDFPAEYDRALELVDEIWAISAFVRDAIARRTSKPVHVIPYQVPELVRVPDADLPQGLEPGTPYVLFMFDYLSVFERKNPVGVVEAFRRAFPDGQGPTLVIKSINGERFRTQRERLRDACRDRGDIRLIEDYLDAGETEALVIGCSAYLSLHRGEGLGLTMSEAMSAGRPVIATGYSGNLDFMTTETSLLVGYELVEIPAGAEPYGPPTRWAEPDLDEAARQLRWIFEHPDEAAELGLRGQESVRGRNDLDRAAAFVTERVTAIMTLLGNDDPDQISIELEPAPTEAASGGPVESAALASLGAARELIDTPARPRLGSRLPAVSRLFQRAVNRLLAAHDEQVNLRLNALLHASSTGHDHLEQVTGEPMRELAEQILHLRRTVATLQATVAQQQVALGGTRSMAASFGTHQSALADRADVLSTLVSESAAESVAHGRRLDELSRLSDDSRMSIEGHRRQLAEVAARLDELGRQLTGDGSDR